MELHDYGCTLKAYDANIVRHLKLYGEMHRFIPALAGMAGARVAEVPVNHRPRTRGTSKYGMSRALRVLLDLLTVKFLLEYLTRPIQFFGRVALWALAGAAACAGLLTAQHLGGFQLMTGGTEVSLAALLTTLGVLVLCVGLLGEVLTRSYYENGERRTYVVRRRAGFPADLSLSAPPPARPAMAGAPGSPPAQVLR